MAEASRCSLSCRLPRASSERIEQPGTTLCDVNKETTMGVFKRISDIISANLNELTEMKRKRGETKK
jgi:hypothetical protein